MIDAFAGKGADLKLVALQRHDIEIIQVNRVSGVSHDRADIAGKEVLLFAHAENERAAAARRRR